MSNKITTIQIQEASLALYTQRAVEAVNNGYQFKSGRPVGTFYFATFTKEVIEDELEPDITNINGDEDLTNTESETANTAKIPEETLETQTEVIDTPQVPFETTVAVDWELIEGMTKKEIDNEALKRGITLDGRSNKADLIASFKAAVTA